MMGAMKDFVIWCEDNDLEPNLNDSAIWDKYMSQRGTVVENQLPLFVIDDEGDAELMDLCDDTDEHDVIIDDGDDMELELPDCPMGQDYTMPLFDENGGLTAEGFDLLYELEQDGGFT